MAHDELTAKIIQILLNNRDVLRELLAAETAFEDGVLPVDAGGTGATTASGARSALGAAATSHDHDGSDITTGTIAEGRLGSGTPGSGNFLRGDGTWTGTLSGTLTCSAINTGSSSWDLGGHTSAADAVSNGYVTVTIGGTSYKLMTRA